jgi:hypothetical protein
MANGMQAYKASKFIRENFILLTENENKKEKQMKVLLL